MNARTLIAVPLTLAGLIATSCAHAGASFKEAEASQDVINCSYASITGKFSGDASSYVATGQCVDNRTNPSGNAPKSNQSQFPDIRNSTQLWHATWTATGSYNATTKMVNETVVLAAPTIDSPLPQNTPYGQVDIAMICDSDPWIQVGGHASCTGIRLNPRGNLGAFGDLVKKIQRPLSATEDFKTQQALWDQRKKQQDQLAARLTRKVSDAPNVALLLPAPVLLAPVEGATQRAGTTIVARTTSGNVKHQTYQFELEVYPRNGRAWTPLATVPVAASLAESPLGTAVWGMPTSGAPHGVLEGNYRLRVSADGGQPSDWHTLKVTANPLTAKAGSQVPLWQPTQGAVTAQNAPPAALSAIARPSVTPPRPVPNWGAAPSALGH
jgi:hypothetical protein